MSGFKSTSTLSALQTTAGLQTTIVHDYCNNKLSQQAITGISLTTSTLNNITPSFFYNKVKGGYLYLIFCTEGKLIIQQEDLLRQSAELQQHHYCILQTITPFTLTVTKNQPATFIILELPIAFALKNMLQHHAILVQLKKAEALQNSNVLFSNLGMTTNIQFCLYALLQREQHNKYKNIFTENKTAELLIHIAEVLDTIPCKASLHHSCLSQESVLRVKRVIQVLEKTPQQHITIIELARQVGTNESYLKKHFKEVTGKTIYAYLLEQRMLLAKQLIANGNVDMQQVSQLTGYKRKHHFLEAFKRHFGFVPLTIKTFLIALYTQLEIIIESEPGYLIIA